MPLTLALSCSELTTIDLRYFDSDLLDTLREIDPDLVLTLYCVSSIGNQDILRISARRNFKEHFPSL